MTPCYSWWELPYYWVGLKMYDALSLTRMLASASWLSREQSLNRFPMLQEKGLKGSVVYYDGQMDDSRMGVGLAVTAAANGAAVANHVEVVNLLKDETGKVIGAQLKDVLSGETWEVQAKAVVNATGPFVDHIRKMDNSASQPMISPSRGIHVVLPDYYSPLEMGLIIPKTTDGRVIFLLPWLGRTVAGTTDVKCELDPNPPAPETDIQYVLDSISKYVRVQVRREDVSAAWAGIRPLAKDPNVDNTAALVRDHVISTSASGLVTITGGKWTTYRAMSEELVDTVVKDAGLKPTKSCQTARTPILGAGGWNNAQFLDIAQNYVRVKSGHGKFLTAPLNTDIAQHLSSSYGSRAFLVAELAQSGYGKRLAHNLPYIEAEVLYATRNEFATTAVDVIARRLRLAFLDSKAAHAALPRTVCLLPGASRYRLLFFSNRFKSI
jgi:glycerol-3-phosphate dehydrogenase